MRKCVKGAVRAAAKPGEIQRHRKAVTRELRRAEGTLRTVNALALDLEKDREILRKLVEACVRDLTGPDGKTFDLSPRAHEVLIDVYEETGGRSVKRQRVTAAELLRRAAVGAPLRASVRQAARELANLPPGQAVPRDIVERLVRDLEMGDAREEVRLVEARIADSRQLVRQTVETASVVVERIAKVVGILKPEASPTVLVQMLVKLPESERRDVLPQMLELPEMKAFLRRIADALEGFPEARARVAGALSGGVA